ncbi:MAG: Uma2 family endonuclease [Cyanobacteria bacterium P01_F01_bin.150]
MVSALTNSPSFVTDTWVSATWDEYIVLIDHLLYVDGRCYYDSGEMKIEMASLGSSHARDNAILSKVVSLFATLKVIRIAEYLNCTFRKPGIRDSQPDIAFYLGPNAAFPQRTNEPVDTVVYGAPQLVIEIASTSLSDDLGTKRLLYERLGVNEYWVVNVATGRVIAFAISNGHSGEIGDSVVLPGLSMETVEEALTRSQNDDDGAINRWLIETFSS